jgi:L-ascorbate metabolism protein UlaG (beta-lactamase superfamily)
MQRLPRRSPLAIVATTLGICCSLVLAAPATTAQGSSVTMEWLGWSHFRFTSPGGKVILTNPFVANPDSPVRIEDITAADLILVPDGHQDEIGSTVEIAQRTGARVIGSGGLNSWFIEQGVPQAQIVGRFIQPGARFRMDGITVRLVESVHGSELPSPTMANPYGGVAAGFFITFENGYTVYFAGSSPAMSEQALWAQMYRPDMAILHMGGDHEPLDIAMQVKLLQTANPNLSKVVPHHHRVTPPAGQTTIQEVQTAMDGMGLGIQMSELVIGQVETFTR